MSWCSYDTNCESCKNNSSKENWFFLNIKICSWNTRHERCIIINFFCNKLQYDFFKNTIIFNAFQLRLYMTCCFHYYTIIIMVNNFPVTFIFLYGWLVCYTYITYIFVFASIIVVKGEQLFKKLHVIQIF